MIAFFVRHRTAANLMMIAFLAAGFFGLGQLRRETFPDNSKTEVQVSIVYPGATADEVEESICQRIEDSLDEVRDVAEVRSEARDGMGVVTIEMNDRGRYSDFRDEIDTAINSIDDFPEEVDEPIIERLHVTDPVVTILVQGPMETPDLKLYCEALKDRITTIPEVSSVTIDGFSEHLLRVELSQEALLRHNLSAEMVGNIIRRQSVDLPAGTVETSGDEVVLRVVEERETASRLADLVIVAGKGGAEVRLGDIGEILDVFEFEEDKLLIDGQRAARLQIAKTKSEDVLRVAGSVKELIERERQQHPLVSLTVTSDMSSLVEDRLALLLTNAWQGMILVFATMWLFFNTRLSFWVVMSLPVSFLGAFFVAPYVGLTINMLTSVALLMALGLLMDDGIVIAENIASHYAQGKSAARAAIDGSSEVAGGVFSSFLTTVCVLGPLAFISGDIGKILRVLPMMLILVLSVSLIEAFFILPAHLAHSLAHENRDKRSGFRQRIDRVVDWVRERVLGTTVDLLLRWRYLTAGVLAGVFLVTISLPASGLIRFQSIPTLDGDEVAARLLMPPGTPLERTEEEVRRLVAGLQRVNERFKPRQPGQRDLVETVFVRFNENKDAFETGPHVATVQADLLAAEFRDGRLDDIFAAWEEEVGPIPDALSVTYTEPAIGPIGRDLEVRLSGPDLEDLDRAAAEMAAWVRPFDGVFNVSDDLRQGKREFHVSVRPGTYGIELDAQQIARQLRAAFHGFTADELQVGDESYEVEVRLASSDRDALTDLETYRFMLPGGKHVPLSAVADINETRNWSRIARINGVRTVTLVGDVDTQRSNTAALVEEMRRSFLPQFRERFPEVAVKFEGEIESGQETGASMASAMLVGMLGVFILLSFQFRSYTEPLIVMIAIPFALVGVIWGHFLFGLNLSMPSIMGYASLAGVVINDSLLLVIFVKRAIAQGEGPDVAAAKASRQRFRAVALTSLTTIAGLMPLLLERSLQAQVLIPIAISICFGLMASTLLVLLIIPTLYAILADFGLTAPAEEEHDHEETPNATDASGTRGLVPAGV
ncbi:Toluene efflux pump membrane transporter TtgB [Planctomycetes bacterium Pan216]|uniref:Toluene efflux pump membrane transporter TtgB n=1 Tax=Kolteria novifilia TaxID=2527975 RepID=A0A518AZB1_9BACT|nr:Toluene efflux pump membrane transporter TtgB [Planctomycetes bacterium Pan216]